MSSTPLFDSVARSRQRAVAPDRGTVAAPTSPMSPPLGATASAAVPSALVAAIEAIPQSVVEGVDSELPVTAEQIVLVEAVADAITRAVVDAVVVELDRIARDGVVRSRAGS